LTTGVGVEKLTLGPAIGKRCFYASVEKRGSVVDVASQSITVQVRSTARDHKTNESSKSQELGSARKTANEVDVSWYYDEYRRRRSFASISKDHEEERKGDRLPNSCSQHNVSTRSAVR
jgi:hypothetical protein